MINRIPSQRCIDIIKQFEGFRAKPYLCPAGVPTIGYGSTRYANNQPVKLTDAPISEEQASNIMKATLEKEYAPAVNRYVQVVINQNQYDALVDFAYNLGINALKTSTLLKKVNKGDMAGAANEFDKWVFSDGKKLDGLVKRRAKEKELFLSAPLAIAP